MASITPTDLDYLGTVSEGDNINVQFSAVLNSNETNADISITAFDSNQTLSVDVSGASISGFYSNSFSLPNGSLQYVFLDTFETCNAANFSQLPDGVNRPVELYQFTAPSPLEKDYSYAITLEYDELPTPPATETTHHTITRTYTHTVVADYDSWKNQLQNYIGD